jgi:hypothetical protein
VIPIRHFVEITDKSTGKKSEDLRFYFKEHRVRILDENNTVFYDSDNYLAKEEPNDTNKDL